MRILIDVGHPAEMHFFHNIASDLIRNGNDVMFSVRDKDCNLPLIDAFGFPYFVRGKGSSHLVGKFFHLFRADFRVIREARKFRPDLFLSFCSPYAAHAAFVLRKPHIAFNDTEHSPLIRLLYKPFTDIIITPDCYRKDLGKKHVRVSGMKELAYISRELGSEYRNESLYGFPDRYVLIRIISHKALHDQAYRSRINREEMVRRLSELLPVFISSEEELPGILKKYSVHIPPSKLHHAIARAQLVISEGATVASEAALLGTPALYHYMRFGYLDELENKYKLLQYCDTTEDLVQKSAAIVANAASRIEHQEKLSVFFSSKMNVREFMVWYCQQWPESKLKMQMAPASDFGFKTDAV